MNSKKLYMESMVRSRFCFGCHSWVMKREYMDRNWYRQQLRLLIPGGFKRKSQTDNDQDFDYAYKVSKKQVYNKTTSTTLESFITSQQINWYSHTVRRGNNQIIKILLFERSKKPLRVVCGTEYLEKIARRDISQVYRQALNGTL